MLARAAARFVKYTIPKIDRALTYLLVEPHQAMNGDAKTRNFSVLELRGHHLRGCLGPATLLCEVLVATWTMPRGCSLVPARPGGRDVGRAAL